MSDFEKRQDLLTNIAANRAIKMRDQSHEDLLWSIRELTYQLLSEKTKNDSLEKLSQILADERFEA